MNQNQDIGGSYAIGEDGTRVLVDRTEDHPDGNRPRDEPQPPAQAKRLGKTKTAPAADQAPATTATTEGAK